MSKRKRKKDEEESLSEEAEIIKTAFEEFKAFHATLLERDNLTEGEQSLVEDISVMLDLYEEPLLTVFGAGFTAGATGVMQSLHEMSQDLRMHIEQHVRQQTMPQRNIPRA